MTSNSFNAQTTIELAGEKAEIFRLDSLIRAGIGEVETLPYSLRVLLENLLRYEDDRTVSRGDIEAVASWDPGAEPSVEIAYRPSRVVMQDFTGVPAVVDLAAMRQAFAEMGGDPAAMNPERPVDLVIDHSVQVDSFGSLVSFGKNVEIEYSRNRERYQFLRWGQQSFDGLRVVPPGTGIIHQVNLEYLASVVHLRQEGGALRAFPDTLVGTDSHTTMINGLGVLGWGVGGIEAEAAILGQPISMLVPQVVGFKLTGGLPSGATATDMVLTVTQMLRSHGVVGKFVEFCGPGMKSLPLPDRATIANMAPEYGATMGFFPVDAETLAYLSFTGRDPQLVERVERYFVEQGMFHTDASPEPRFSQTLELDLGEVVPSIAGPKRPQDRIPLSGAKRAWRKTLIASLEKELEASEERTLTRWADEGGTGPSGVPTVDVTRPCETDRGRFELANGAVVIAAITSCTNTSNPSVMLGAGLLAKKALERGLTVKPWVKTSLAPGSQVVTAYLEEAGLTEPLQKLGFYLVGYGCTTCIGNSGPVDEAIAAEVARANLVVTSVLSGNRNFEGRVSPTTRANYLASPPLVVAYALAGTMDIDFERDPIGTAPGGEDIFLADIWPSGAEIAAVVRDTVKREQFISRYAEVFTGTDEWRALEVPSGLTYQWEDDSTYVRLPPFFENLAPEPTPPGDIEGARVLALLGDSVTTDHISPAGSIAVDSPAGRYLRARGVEPRQFNSYGSRRGNHEVMMRGTFANIRLRNQLAPGTEGGFTRQLPGGEVTTIYDASMAYQSAGVPLIVIAGKEYGTGSSRDWAAKGTLLLGVKAVIAQSYERIHRSNLVGMGVLPLQFESGEGPRSLGLTGEESFSIRGIEGGVSPGQRLEVTATSDGGEVKEFEVVCRVDTPQEVEYLRHGGILPYVLRAKALG
jgi:aconitate hydratase